MLKKTIKYILNILGLVIAIPLFVFRPLISLLSFFLRSIYSQWMRLSFSKSYLDTTICFPCNLRGGRYIECGKGVFLGNNGILSAWDNFHGVRYKPNIVFGDYVTIGSNFHISAISNIIIGDNVLTGKYVTIVDNGHGYTTRCDMEKGPKERDLRLYESVIIEKNVWIGDKVTITGNVHIGEGAIIGSNSVITKDVPAYSVVVGVPGKVIKQL